MSWLMMGIELPLLSAVVARLANPEINLAAYGGVVFPLSLLIEAPIIMLLTASTKLSRDLNSYSKLWKFTIISGGSLSIIHLLIAVTPIFDLVAGNLLGVEEEILETSRLGMIIMTPWTFAIAHRRFNQGILIRFGQPKAVGWGTLVRLAADTIVLFTCFSLAPTLKSNSLGIIAATAAVSAGVIAEAAYAAWRVRPIIQNTLPNVKSSEPPITRKGFLSFYIPLALSPLLGLAAQPVLTAGISRMPSPIESLAILPAVNGFTFLFRSVSLAFLEVVVALIEKPGGYPALRRFAWQAAITVFILQIIIVSTPLARIWFETVSGLNPKLGDLAATTVWAAITLAATGFGGSFCQGLLVHSRKTRNVTESVGLFLVVVLLGLTIGAYGDWITGAIFALMVYSLGQVAQFGWLLFRSHSDRQTHCKSNQYP
tara:strand:+ start:131 stop:1414 length:1284 start_codon:yes stop_codon:yes gene_type:complete